MEIKILGFKLYFIMFQFWNLKLFLICKDSFLFSNTSTLRAISLDRNNETYQNIHKINFLIWIFQFWLQDPIELTEIGWREFLERQTSKMSAEFKDYRPLTGSWVFRVEHFSKYGLSVSP